MAKEKKNLVIVESPAKAKTIEKYLGADYKVTASMGHLRDLPKSVIGVDIEHGFTPDYQPVKGKEENIKQLRLEAKKSERIYLATDPDREGEAISWHLKELLGLSDDQVYRVTFNEITKNIVTDSIKHPRAIDKDLVDAQQARRLIDRIVGYKLSPFLWRKIRRGLSAGRVQSVAARMVVDRENEIRAFNPQEYWLVDAELMRIEKPGGFIARYYGEGNKKRELNNEAEANEIIEDVKDSPFVISAVKRMDRKKSPSPPFITSTLQQDASRRLGMTPRRTMSVAQQLYEGVDIRGEGTTGLITYMRTDSLRISEEALTAAMSFILSRYGREYHPGAPRRFKSKNSAQDAHEAIRPANPALVPDDIKTSLTSEQYKLYRLIWSRFIASQMTNAVYNSVAIDVESAGHLFRANRSTLKFPGYTAVYEESNDDEKELPEPPLPDLKENEAVNLRDIKKEQKFTQPPTRYTEAALIKAMEDNGVGRPSTYAPTISTVLDRDYVVKDGKYLRPTLLGETVTELMKERFPDIVDLMFTARMEEDLDEIERGGCEWRGVLEQFYGPFSRSLEEAESALEGKHIKVPDEVSEELCDICGRNLIVKSGKFGRFLACPGFPECTFTKPLVVEMPGKCPKCGSRILKRKSLKGYTYYACDKLKECGFMTWDVPVKDDCSECGQTLFKRSGRGYNKPFCINPECANFLPEENRGYRKTVDSQEPPSENAGSTEKKRAKKTKNQNTKKSPARKPKKK